MRTRYIGARGGTEEEGASRPSQAKLAFIDVETTGLNPQLHTVWSFAGIVEVDGALETITFRCRPTPGAVIDDKALSIGGISLEELNNLEDPREAKIHLEAALGRHADKFNRIDKFHFIGYNAKFDADFLRNWYLQMGDSYYGSWFWNPPIDVMNLASYVLMEERHRMKDFKLATVARQFSIDVDESKTHDPLYDIQLTMQLYKRLETITRD